MVLEAALVKEQGVTFVVVTVKRHVLHSTNREDVRAGFSAKFGGVPCVLMTQDSKGVPTYHGRDDLVRFLTKVPLDALPWKRWAA